MKPAQLRVIEYLGNGQMHFGLPQEWVLGPAAVGGQMVVDGLAYRIVDVGPDGREVILGPLEFADIDESGSCPRAETVNTNGSVR